MGTRSDWANVGRDFKKLGTDFGKTFIKTVKKGAKAVDNWANDDNNSVDEQKTEKTNNQDPVAETTFVSDDK